jgi:probable rRNA maturation factor
MNLMMAVERATLVPTPEDDAIELWVTQAIETANRSLSPSPELSIRITDTDEAAQFNETYRAKAGATNVLSFPASPPPETHSGLLGDLVICAPLVIEEAQTQDKQATAHWAHLVMHGVLHLLGYDHQTAAEAEAMELLEISALARLGYANPYDIQTPLGSPQA